MTSVTTNECVPPIVSGVTIRHRAVLVLGQVRKLSSYRTRCYVTDHGLLSKGRTNPGWRHKCDIVGFCC